MPQSVTEPEARGGFTLVELAVVIVLVGVLASFGVPRLLKSVERSRAADAFAYLDEVREAQARFYAREGFYATSLADLGVTDDAPRSFTVPDAVTTSADSWTLTLTRVGPSSGYGPYTVSFTQDGYDPANSTIDKRPEIVPQAPAGSTACR